MNKNEIIGQLAKERLAERIVEYYCKGMGNRPELADLCQYVYQVLLEMDDKRIETAYEEGWLPFLVRRIIINQVRTKHSPWRDLYTAYYRRFVSIDDVQIEDK